MTNVYDVPPDPLLAKVSATLAADPKFAPPEWARVAKTGVHREKAPHTPTWWPTRVASVLRRVYIDGPIGVIHLSSKYGGTRDRGSKPNRARGGSRSIVRTALQQLETADYVQAIKGKGRVVTAKGRSLLDNAAHSVAQTLEAKMPELKKY
jgi:small subunit ribosomal protein S19e